MVQRKSTVMIKGLKTYIKVCEEVNLFYLSKRRLRVTCSQTEYTYVFMEQSVDSGVLFS